MKQIYEYSVSIWKSNDLNDAKTTLNNQAIIGWELVAVSDFKDSFVIGYFKRKISE